MAYDDTCPQGDSTAPAMSADRIARTGGEDGAPSDGNGAEMNGVDMGPFTVRPGDNLGRLAGGIAHNFNNQLTVIMGYCRLLEQRFGEEPQVREYARSIQAAADYSALVTSHLLSYSGKQMLAPRRIMPNVLLRDIESAIRARIMPGIRFEAGEEVVLRAVRVDTDYFAQAVEQLVENAIGAMPDGGTLALNLFETEFESGPSEAIGESRPGRYVGFEVRDTGVGMEDEVRAQIFEPFFTTREVGQGLGLGLSMVYGFVVQSGGFLRVRSAPGQGTSISMFFPCS
jgi:signal transduction histidine kinase